MAHDPNSVPPGASDLRLFPQQYDVVRVSLVIEAHNITGLVDATLQVYGGPHGHKLCRHEMIDVPTTRAESFLDDVAGALAEIFDAFVGPF